jgi:hypothetical protein
MPIYDMTEVAQLQVANDPGDDLNILDSSPALAGVDVLAVPWGQLVYDYFTALPFSNQFDPVNGFAVGGTPLEAGNIADGLETPATDDGVPGDAGFARYLRANQPTVTAGGLVVHGRINLNAAPWKVLEGLPMFSPWQMPIYKDMKVSLFPGGFGTPGNSNAVPRNMTWTQLTHPWVNPSEAGPYTPMQSLTNTALTPLNAAAYGGGGVPAALEQLGRERAESIVAYREMRPVVQVDAAGVATIPSTGNYNVLTLSGKRVRSNTTGTPWELADQRQTAGFLTVGELANVRLSNPAHQGPFTSPSDGLMAYHMDNGQHLGSFYPSQTTTQANYLVAVAPLVALNDSWLTVKGHSYTLYGTLRGAGRQVHLANDPDTPENDYGLPGDIQKNAVRFEVGIDRSNLLTSPANPSLRPAITYSVREPYLSAN